MLCTDQLELFGGGVRGFLEMDLINRLVTDGGGVAVAGKKGWRCFGQVPRSF